MNRIILIGNGFDRAHNLPTAYKHFIDAFWRAQFEKAKNEDKTYANEYFTLTINDATYNLKKIISKCDFSGKGFAEIIEEMKRVNSLFIESNAMLLERHNMNPRISCRMYMDFLKHITDKCYLNWVDIENEYYSELIKIANKSKEITNYQPIIDKLNKEFTEVERLLEKYLTGIQSKIDDSIINLKIKDKIYAPIKFSDISTSHTDIFVEEILQRIEKEEIKEQIFRKYENRSSSLFFNIEEVENFREKYKNYKIHIEGERRAKEGIKDHLERNSYNYYTIPEEVLFLNFNYTPTADYYISAKSDVINIHIHGELNNKENPMIFGYGDELAEDYKMLENLNDNKFTKNVKSIRYHETANYRKLLQFVASAPYQIFIMGHSCGNSDRTLLNTLFEHPNCVSIKPFYHRIDENTDNYNDIVQNISRNFKDKVLMRDRVVNKTYCEPLS